MNDNILEHAQLPGSLELAYVGDAIYEVAVRRRIVKTGAKVSALHRQAVSRVCAHAQAEAFGRVEAMLTPEEAAVARRARNAHQSPPATRTGRNITGPPPWKRWWGICISPAGRTGCGLCWRPP